MNKKFELEVSETGCSAYLRLPNYPPESEQWKVSKTVQLIDILGPYEGPEIIFDFGPDGDLIGVEILVNCDDDDEDSDESDC